MLSRYWKEGRNKNTLLLNGVANDNQAPWMKRLSSRVINNYIDNLPIVLGTFAAADMVLSFGNYGPREYYMFAAALILLVITLPLDATRKLAPFSNRERKHVWVALAIAGFAILQIRSGISEMQEMEASRFQAALVEETAKAILPGISPTFEHTEMAQERKAKHAGNGWELTAEHLDNYSIIGIHFSGKGRCRTLLEKARPYTSTLSTVTLNETTFLAWPSAKSIRTYCGERVVMRLERNPARI